MPANFGFLAALTAEAQARPKTNLFRQNWADMPRISQLHEEPFERRCICSAIARRTLNEQNKMSDRNAATLLDHWQTMNRARDLFNFNSKASLCCGLYLSVLAATARFATLPSTSKEYKRIHACRSVVTLQAANSKFFNNALSRLIEGAGQELEGTGQELEGTGQQLEESFTNFIDEQEANGTVRESSNEEPEAKKAREDAVAAVNQLWMGPAMVLAKRIDTGVQELELIMAEKPTVGGIRRLVSRLSRQ